VVAGRTGHNLYYATQSDTKPRLSSSGDEKFYLRSIRQLNSAGSMILKMSGADMLSDRFEWDIIDRMIAPFNMNTGYPAFYLEELVGSPHPSLKSLAQQANGDDMAQPFIFPLGSEMTSHDRIEAYSHLQQSLSLYACCNNWHRRFEMMPPVAA
jgi:hypothetical protein